MTNWNHLTWPLHLSYFCFLPSSCPLFISHVTFLLICTSSFLPLLVSYFAGCIWWMHGRVFVAHGMAGGRLLPTCESFLGLLVVYFYGHTAPLTSSSYSIWIARFCLLPHLLSILYHTPKILELCNTKLCKQDVVGYATTSCLHDNMAY